MGWICCFSYFVRLLHINIVAVNRLYEIRNKQFYMKKNFINVLAALTLASAGVVSCVLEAPEINYQVNYQNVADFSGIIAAINNSTMSTQQRLDLIAESLDKQTYTMAQKIEFLEAALKNGLTNLEKASQMLKESLVKTINDQTLILNSKMTALETAVKSGTLTLGDKLEVIKTAINNQTASQVEASKLTREAFVAAITSQTATMKERLTALETAVKNETLVLSDKLSVIQTAINNQTVEETKALGLFKTAVNDAITSQKTTLSQALAAINTSVTDYNNAFQTKVDVLTNQIKTNGATTKECLDAINTSVKESAGSISDHIDLMAALIANQIETGTESIAKKINTMGANLKASIDDSKEVIKVTIASLDTAIRRGSITLDEAIQGVTSAVNYQTGQIEVAAGVIADQVTVGAVTLRDGLAALKSGFDKQNEFIWAIGESLKQMLAEGNANLVTIKTAIEAAKEAIGTQTGAINDQTAWIAAVGNMVSGAIQGQTTDLTQIIGEVKTALGEQTTAINGQTAWIAAVGEGVSKAIADQTTTLEAAIYEVCYSVDAETDQLEAIYGILESCLKSGNVTITDAIRAVKDAVAGITNQIKSAEWIASLSQPIVTAIGNNQSALQEAILEISYSLQGEGEETISSQIALLTDILEGCLKSGDFTVADILNNMNQQLAAGNTNLEALKGAIKGTLTTAIKDQTTTLEAAIKAIGTAIDTTSTKIALQIETLSDVVEQNLASEAEVKEAITEILKTIEVATITEEERTAIVAALNELETYVRIYGGNDSPMLDSFNKLINSLNGTIQFTSQDVVGRVNALCAQLEELAISFDNLAYELNIITLMINEGSFSDDADVKTAYESLQTLMEPTYISLATQYSHNDTVTNWNALRAAMGEGSYSLPTA